MKNALRQSLRIIQENPESYLLINFFYYSIFVVGLIYAYIHPSVYEFWHGVAQEANKHGLLSIVHNAYYGNRNFVLAILLTFVVNVVLGAAIQVSVSSLIVPFLGCLVAAGRAFLWGLIFSPGLLMAKPSILFVILLEGQGYVLAAFGAYLQGARFLRPKRFNLNSHKEGFFEGAKLTSRIYPLIVAVLLVSAIIEVHTSGAMIGPTSQNPFPSLIDPKFKLHVLGTNASVDFKGLRVSYDSTNVKLNDAKIAALALHDVGYAGPIVVSRESLDYRIRISLPLERWTNPEIVRRLGVAATYLKKPFLNRWYAIAVCSEDSLGNWRENVLVQK